jgi:hypothetical protein
MAKVRLCVTLEENNVRWLRGRSAIGRRSVSETVDALLSTVRHNGQPPEAARSVVGTITHPPADPDLAGADAAVRSWVRASLARTSTMGTLRTGRAPRRLQPVATLPGRLGLSVGRRVKKMRRS